ncbi:hypothetical protein [Paraconexibacter sp. AEG42_29]
MARQPPSSPDDPWWLRAMEPLRSEAAMFRVLIVVAAVCGALIALTLLLRAVF